MPGKINQTQYLNDLNVLGDLAVTGDTSLTGDLALTGALTKNEADLYAQDAVTATADGLTTGLMTFAMGFITVTSAGANNIIRLPSCVAADAGRVISGWVGANGCEMRSAVGDGATINGVDCDDGNNEAAIPATTKFEAHCIAADTWLLHCWTELGAVLTAIIPDAV